MKEGNIPSEGSEEGGMKGGYYRRAAGWCSGEKEVRLQARSRGREGNGGETFYFLLEYL